MTWQNHSMTKESFNNYVGIILSFFTFWPPHPSQWDQLLPWAWTKTDILLISFSPPPPHTSCPRSYWLTPNQNLKATFLLCISNVTQICGKVTCLRIHTFLFKLVHVSFLTLKDQNDAPVRRSTGIYQMAILWLQKFLTLPTSIMLGPS